MAFGRTHRACAHKQTRNRHVSDGTLRDRGEGTEVLEGCAGTPSHAPARMAGRGSYRCASGAPERAAPHHRIAGTRQEHQRGHAYQEHAREHLLEHSEGCSRIRSRARPPSQKICDAPPNRSRASSHRRAARDSSVGGRGGGLAGPTESLSREPAACQRKERAMLHVCTVVAILREGATARPSTRGRPHGHHDQLTRTHTNSNSVPLSDPLAQPHTRSPTRWTLSRLGTPLATCHLPLATCRLPHAACHLPLRRSAALFA